MIRFTEPRRKRRQDWQWITKAKTKGGKKATLNKLKSFINTATPGTVDILVSGWNAQQNSVTYKELREAYLAGGLTEKQFQKWQKDYSKLITSTLAPQWQQAADLAAQDVQAQYPYFVYEPSISASMDYIKQHGAELVTNMANEQRDALNAVIQRCSGYTATTPDEAARTMRACIGLTKPQALANVNYREAVKNAYLKAHPKANPATAEKKADEAAARYAGRQHRYRAQNIARTELAYAYNAGAYGATKDAQAQGYIGACKKVWLTAFDERVCPICSTMDGETCDMDGAFSNGKTLPPAHPQCRCAVAYEEIPGTNLNTAPQNGTMNAQGQAPAAAQPVSPNQPAVPPDIQIPNGMTYKGPANMGGTGEMYIYEDADGNQWLFKPAQAKNGQPAAYRAYTQEAGYKVQAIVDPDTAVPVGTGTLNGKFGAFQQRVNTVNGVNLKAWQNGYGGVTDADITPEMLEQLQREHVTDWLLGNFDGHGGNFVTDVSGNIIGIDKEQAFKYLKDTASHTMSYSYHPNAKYGETEPIANTMFRKFAHGEIDIDPDATLKYIQRVEAVPDDEYREIFRDYAESRLGKGAAAEQLLDEIVERKSTLRETYKDFYSDLLTERNGTPTTFQFADELAGTVVPATPKTTPLATTKPKTTKPKTTKPTQAPTKTQSGYKATEVMSDLTVLPKTMNGTAVRSDGGMVEGLNLTGRTVNIGGTEYYELTGKLTEDSWAAAVKNAKKRGYSSTIEFYELDASRTGFDPNTKVQFSLPSYKVIRPSQATFEVYSDYQVKEQFGLTGYFRARVPATGNTTVDAQAMQDILDTAGLKSLTEDPTDAEETLLKKARLAWQHDPQGFEKTRNLTGKAKETALDNILAAAGIDQQRVQNMTLEEVYPGYSTYIDSAAVAGYKKAGATHVWAGVKDKPSSVVRICKNGLISTNTRTEQGVSGGGDSEDQDREVGGSDSVFTRIGTKSKTDYGDNYLGWHYRVIFSPDVLARTDWYAYTGDKFGETRTSGSLWQSRLSTDDYIQSTSGKNYRRNNEIMFRHGLSTDLLVGVSCETDRKRTALLDEFRRQGISEINGVKIEDFVQVTSQIGEDSKRGLKGLSYYGGKKTKP